MNKKIKLPKDGLVEPESGARQGDFIGDDVEGHGLPTTAPPSGLAPRTPGHGGEAIPDEDDVKDQIVRM